MNKPSLPSMKNAPLRLNKETVKNLRVATGVKAGLSLAKPPGVSGSVIDSQCAMGTIN